MVFDIQRGRIVLFGGNATRSPGPIYLGETWEWDGSTWTLVSTAGPAPRTAAAMAYDSVRGRSVLFGGYSPATGVLGDTWEWDGAAWAQVAASGPPVRHYHAMAFDGPRGKTMLFGGRASGGPSSGENDTWEWDGAAWGQLGGPAPPVRWIHAMVFDSARRRMVTFGGVWSPSGVGIFLDDTWERGTALATTGIYGASCGSPPVTFGPHVGSRPMIGQAQLSDVGNAPFGFAAVVWGVTQQALSLDFLGITGCTLLNGAEMEIGSFCASTSFSSAQHNLAIPYDLTLLGVRVYLQAWVLAPGYNPFGIALSNGLELVIGDV
ncbi:MAG: hypothetical protein JNK78_03375 [Planctomycetes bacterium]|nr:hypothetical protein [Planctomycetota bacterium]